MKHPETTVNLYKTESQIDWKLRSQKRQNNERMKIMKGLLTQYSFEVEKSAEW